MAEPRRIGATDQLARLGAGHRHDRPVTIATMSLRRWIARSVACALLGTTVAAFGASAAPGTDLVQAANDLGAGGEYHPLEPSRIYDTRSPGINDTAPLGKKPTSAEGSNFRVDVLGQGGVPDVAGNVLAVVVNVVVAEPEAQGNLSVAPAGSAGAVSSLVNFLPGRNVPNLAIVGVGVDGAIDVKLTTPKGASRAHVAIDVFGWISTTAAPARGARFVPVGPGRLLDTRTAGFTALGAGQSISLQIRGADSMSPALTDIVPDDASVTGVMINIAAINRQTGSTNTYVSATPNPVPAGQQPTTSNTNVKPGLVKASMAIVPVGPDGKIHLYNFRGNMHLAVDVLGYLQTGAPSATREGRVIPLEAPFRVFDTRDPAFGNLPLAAGRGEDWSFQDFVDSVTLGGTPLGKQSALIGNLTGTGLQRVVPYASISTYMTMYPGNAARPEASNINVPEGENVPNMSMLRFGAVERDGNTDPYVVRAYNYNGSIHYLVDVYAVVLAD
jgi:hypothetical protein